MPTANEQYQAAKATNNVSFTQEWARTQKALAKMTAGERTAALGFTSLQVGEHVKVFDALGQARMRIGHQSDGTVAIVYGNGPPPPVPTDPIVSARQLAILVYWDGKFAPDESGTAYARPGDFSRCDVHMSDDPDFLPDGTTVVGSLVAEGQVLLVADNETHYIKIVAVNTSDVASAATATQAVLPLPVDQLAAGVIGAQEIAADIGFISRLVVGDVNSVHLELEGRQGMPPGMVLYDASLMPTLTLDAQTGDVSMRGELRTADTGERLILREDPNTNDLRAYPARGGNYAQFYARTFTGNFDVDYGAFLLRAGYQGDFEIYNTYMWVTHNGWQVYRGLHDGADAGSIIDLTDDHIDIKYMIGVGLGVPSELWLDATSAKLSAFGYGSALILDTNAYLYGSHGSNLLLDYNATLRSGNNGFELYMAGNTYHWSWLDRLIWYKNNNCGVQFNVSGFDIYNPNSGGYLAVGASAFVVQSQRDTKTNIEALPFDPEQVITDAPVTMWERRVEHDDEHPGPHKYVGPMAEDVPEVLQRETGIDGTLGLDIAAQVGVLWAAVAQQSARLAALEHGQPPPKKEPRA